MVQVKKACDIAEAKYNPEKHTIVFSFWPEQLPHEI